MLPEGAHRRQRAGGSGSWTDEPAGGHFAASERPAEYAAGVRYLGTARNNASLNNRPALNRRNLISRGLARNNGTGVLA